MNENILSWNVENWITVILMASIGFFILGIAQKYWQGRVSRNAPQGKQPSTQASSATSTEMSQ